VLVAESMVIPHRLASVGASTEEQQSMLEVANWN
jgi:hypothetical protein